MNAMTATQAGIVPSGSTTNSASTGTGSSYTYCHATANSQGTVAFMGFVGSLDLAQSTLALFCTGTAIHPQGFGMFVCGTNQADMPFGHGFLCINPFMRMSTVHLTGETVVLAMSTTPAAFAMFTPGSSWNVQFLYRDAAPGGVGINSSSALHIDFAQ
jgi:hypothetical protein